MNGQRRRDCQELSQKARARSRARQGVKKKWIENLISVFTTNNHKFRDTGNS